MLYIGYLRELYRAGDAETGIADNHIYMVCLSEHLGDSRFRALLVANVAEDMDDLSRNRYLITRNLFAVTA